MDIAPKSEAARVVLIVQMLGDLALLGGGARVLLGAVRRGQQRGSDAADGAGSAASGPRARQASCPDEAPVAPGPSRSRPVMHDVSAFTLTGRRCADTPMEPSTNAVQPDDVIPWVGRRTARRGPRCCRTNRPARMGRAAAWLRRSRDRVARPSPRCPSIRSRRRTAAARMR